MKSNNPIIGITCSQNFDISSYEDILIKNGAIVEIINSEDEISASDLLSKVDGFLLPDGPNSYGSDSVNEQIETNLVTTALKNKIPILGIGRGMHILNVALGGTVSDIPVESDHFTSLDEDSVNFHRIFISPGSRLAMALGSGGFVRVNSKHRKCIKESDKSQKLMSTAWGLEDGIVEALESPVHDWALGVQFLPQRRGEIPPHFDKLFNVLIQKAKPTI